MNEFDYEAFERFLQKGAPELIELFEDPIKAAWPGAVEEIRNLPETPQEPTQ